MKILLFCTFSALVTTFNVLATPQKTLAVDHPFLVVLLKKIVPTTVEVIYPIAKIGDPHHYRLNAKEVKSFLKSDFVMGGPFSVSPWMRKIFDKKPGKVAEIAGGKNKSEDHYWLSPKRVCQTLKQIEVQLKSWQITPGLIECKTDQIDQKMRNLASKFKGTKILISHGSLNSVLVDYGFDVLTLRKSDHHQHMNILEVKKLIKQLKMTSKGVFLDEHSIHLPQKVQKIVAQKKFPEIKVETYHPTTAEVFTYLEVLAQQLEAAWKKSQV